MKSNLRKIQTGESPRTRSGQSGLDVRIALDSWDVKEQDWWTEACWNLKHDFSNFEKYFGKIRVSARARVSCLVLVNLLGIYRVY